MRGILYIASISILALLGCEKLDEPSLEGNTPMFFVEGFLNGDAMKMEAGNDSLFMHTLYEIDSFSIHDFTGCLGHLDCSHTDRCLNSLTVSFRDASPSSGGSSDVENTLVPRTFSYIEPQDSATIGYAVQFADESHAYNGNLSYFWDFGDGNTSTLANPIHLYDASQAPGALVCLTVTNTSSGASSTTCNYVLLPQNCTANFSYTFTGNTLSALNATESGTAPYTYLWDFGSGFLPLASQTLPDFSIIDSLQVCLKVIDANNCEAVMCRSMVVNPTQIEAAANFNWSVKENKAYLPFNFEEVKVVYVDDAGNVWSSDAFEQPSSSMFALTEVRNHDVNHLGNPTKALDIEAACRLYGQSKIDFIELTDLKGTIAVAHP